VPTKSNDTDDIPPHGTLARIRQLIPDDRRAGNALPDLNVEPSWLAPKEPPAAAAPAPSGGS
jgi:hypothetical protein